MNLKNNYFPIIALILASIIWGATGPVMKQTLTQIPIFSLAFIRFGAATFLLFPFVFKKLYINKKDLNLLVLCALLGVTFNIAFFFWGLTLTTAINSGIIIASTPIFTLLFAHFFLHEKISKNFYLGGVLGIIGISVLIGKDILINGLNLSPLGDLIIILAVVSFVLYEILSKKIFKTYSSFTITFYSFLIGSLSFLPAVIYEYTINPTWIKNISNTSLVGIFYGIFFSSLAAYLLWQWGLSKTQVSKVGFFFYLDPVASTITAVLILSEKITVEFLIGSLLVLLGLLLAESKISYYHLILKNFSNKVFFIKKQH